jgi:epoxyqueuosine reductase
MTPEERLDRIKELGLTLHLDAIGSCRLPFSPALRRHLEEGGKVPFVPDSIEERLHADALLPGARSAIVILFPYGYTPWEDGNIAMYARPRDYHQVCRQYMDNLITLMKEAFEEGECYPLVDTSPLSDRWLAYASGLGFYGKNRCLINPRYGSLFTIGSILTTWELPEGSPLPCGCGDCHRCISACPGHALSDSGFNPWVCKSFLTQKKDPLTPEEERIIGRTPLIFGCDECQKACPFNQKAQPSPLPETGKDRIPALSRELLEQTSNRAFSKTYRDYAFSWRGKKILLRNLNIVEKKDK